MAQPSDYTGYTFSPGQTIYYSFNVNPLVLWSIGGFNAFQMTTAGYRAQVTNAFNQWEAVANVTFQHTADWAQADIGVYWHTLDYAGGNLGYALPIDLNGNGLLEADAGEGVLIGMDPYDTPYFTKTILHEIGHALGLGHNTHTYSLMAPFYEDMAPTITDYDIAVVQSIYGAPGGSVTTTTTSSSTISGTGGADNLIGTGGADTIYGGSGADTIYGGDGADLIYGNRESDLIYGGAGNDTIFGGQNDGPADGGGIQRHGMETIYGGDGDDLIYGNMGADLLWGGDGNDTLYGGQDDDHFYGGRGNDLLFGNLGADRFHYNFANDGAEGHDTIVGWSGDDMLVLWNTSVASTTDLADRTRIQLSNGTSIDIIGVKFDDVQYQQLI